MLPGLDVSGMRSGQPGGPVPFMAGGRQLLYPFICPFGILAAVAIGKLESRFLARSVVKLLIPAVLFNVTVTGVSNWKGALGLSPVKLVHKGYFDHWQQERRTWP